MEQLLDEQVDILPRPAWPHVAGVLGGFAIAIGGAWLLPAASHAAFGVFAAGAAALAIAWLRLGRVRQGVSCIGVAAAFVLGLGTFDTLQTVRTFVFALAWSLVAFAATHATAKGLPFVRVFAAIAAMPAISLVLALHLSIEPGALLEIALVCFSLLGVAIGVAMMPRPRLNA